MAQIYVLRLKCCWSIATVQIDLELMIADVPFDKFTKIRHPQRLKYKETMQTSLTKLKLILKQIVGSGNLEKHFLF